MDTGRRSRLLGAALISALASVSLQGMRPTTALPPAGRPEMSQADQTFRVSSPDGAITASISVGDRLAFDISWRGRALIGPSPISMTLGDGVVLGRQPQLLNVRRLTVSDPIEPVVPEKYAQIEDRYNELALDFQGGWGLEVRAYDDGMAYRFRVDETQDLTVYAEGFDVVFEADPVVWFHTEESFLTHSERLYERLRVSEIPAGKMASLPVLIGFDDGPKLAITESDLRDYPGLYLEGTGVSALHGIHPAYPAEQVQVGDRTVKVTRRADYIARTRGARTFPWRLLVVAEEDGDLIESTMVFRLAPQLRIADASWIRPGKVAWDWWNANNVYDVGFRAGLNTSTYKYYIDFAADHGIEYVILDEGWSDPADLWKLNSDIDLESLLAYARERGVGLILWVVWKTLDDRFEEAMDRFSDWGVAGIKVDFMQRDDQPMVNYYWKVAEAAAQRRLLVDFHGAYKPAGLRRAYPNVLTREGVRGLEHSKWDSTPDPEHNVTIPFIRMLAGPMDYTPGAMLNAQKRQFHPVFDRPMSLGTRVHQVAMYVVYESPLQMLSDSPSNYLREKECLAFIADVPTVWDETRVLSAQVSDWVAVARRRGDVWYVGAMTDWAARDLVLDFSFLGSGEWEAVIFEDGLNADRNAGDYRRRELTLGSGDRLSIKLAAGGGWAARIELRD
ncbi:MAG: glycoside hydrolase family 97 protein [Gemmatimonadota bacterium]|nr:MAG: glycoside hydrolase family 97 protein [Gemmatimonadota bacterium]